MEKVIEGVHGDVVILNDKSCVRPEEISIVGEGSKESPVETPANGELAEIQAREKEALRTRLDNISETTLMADIIDVIKEVDPSMSITATNLEDITALKQILTRTALRLRKIDPKICGECGQVIPE